MRNWKNKLHTYFGRFTTVVAEPKLRDLTWEVLSDYLVIVGRFEGYTYGNFDDNEYLAVCLRQY